MGTTKKCSCQNASSASLVGTNEKNVCKNGIQWIKCYMHMDTYVGTTAVCLLPVCSACVCDDHLLKGTFLNVLAPNKGCHGNQNDMRMLSLMELHEKGVPKIISPFKRYCKGCKAESHVPFFLRCIKVAGIYICPDAKRVEKKRSSRHGRKGAMSNSRYRQSVQSNEDEDDDNTASQELFHPHKPPSFKNICGSIYLSCMRPLQHVPTNPDARWEQQAKLLLALICILRGACFLFFACSHALHNTCTMHAHIGYSTNGDCPKEGRVGKEDFLAAFVQGIPRQEKKFFPCTETWC